MKASSPRLLAAALVVLELIAGIQVYVSATVTPLMAQALNGRHLYGVATACTQVAVFLAMPLAPALRARWSAARLLTWLTPVTVLAACAAALAPTMALYIAARVLSGLSSGAMSGIGMGLIATELTGRARRITLAAMNGMWVISSLVGPAYAAWLAAAFSWRIALVAYLPFLVAARSLIVRELRRRGDGPRGSSTRLPIQPTLCLAGGIALLGARPLDSVVGAACALIGVLLVGVGARRLLPSSLWTPTTPGAPSALRSLLLAAATLFGAESILTIVAHDRLGFQASTLGWLLMLGGLVWAVLGMVTAARPASARRFAVQGSLGHGCLGIGVVVLAIAAGGVRWATPLMFAGWILANLGMGLVYLDAMNMVLDADSDNAFDPTVAGAALALGEPLVAAITSTLCTGWVAAAPRQADGAFGILALLSLGGVWASLRVPSRAARTTPVVVQHG